MKAVNKAIVAMAKTGEIKKKTSVLKKV